jgi:plastocyanin domain-containing protein
LAGCSTSENDGSEIFNSDSTKSTNIDDMETVQSGEKSSSDEIMENRVQVINSTLTSRSYPAITVQVGVPGKWIIDAPQGSINGCNNRIFIKEYDIEHTFTEGENIIEFTPDKTGTFKYNCWMGMIHSAITVVDNSNSVSFDAI